MKKLFEDPPERSSEKTSKNERFGSDFGARFGTQNRSKVDYVFCGFVDPLKKRYSNDFELQNDPKMEPFSTTFRK